MRDVDARLGEVRVEPRGALLQEAVQYGEAELEAGHAVGPLRSIRWGVIVEVMCAYFYLSILFTT